MALKWMEGFEHRQHSDYMTRMYASWVGAAFSSVQVGRKHGGAVRSANSQFTTRALVGSVQNTWIYQFAVRKVDNQNITNSVVFELNNSVGVQLSVVLFLPPAPDNDGTAFKIEIRRGATVLATANRLFQSGTAPRGWWTFQLKATIRTGTLGSIELRAWDFAGNMTTVVPSTTGINTANQGTDGADRAAFRIASTTANFELDDIVLMDSTGTVNNDLTATPIIVYGERANADVAGELDWVPSSGSNHFDLVDDAPTSPAGTDEVTSDVVGDVDLYGHSQAQLDLAPTGSPPTVLGIQVDMEGLMKTSGTRTVRARFKDGVNQADDTTDLVFSDTAKISRFAVLEQNPTGTPAAWSIATLKTIEFGPKLNA